VDEQSPRWNHSAKRIAPGDVKHVCTENALKQKENRGRMSRMASPAGGRRPARPSRRARSVGRISDCSCKKKVHQKLSSRSASVEGEKGGERRQRKRPRLKGCIPATRSEGCRQKRLLNFAARRATCPQNPPTQKTPNTHTPHTRRTGGRRGGVHKRDGSARLDREKGCSPLACGQS